ncbi:MAG: hypothetical protein ACD_33C00011G0003, partial [uncultured bacterium]
MRVNIFREGGYSGGGFDVNGGTLTGPLTLAANPTQLLETSTKEYVDTSISSHSGNTVLHLNTNDKTLLSNITVSSSDINKLAGITSSVQSQLNTKALITGGTFTGFITLHANPTNSMHAVTKQYIDAALPDASSGLSIGDVVRKTV